MGRKPKSRGYPRFRPGSRNPAWCTTTTTTAAKRKETALGSDYGLAIQKWAELERATTIPTDAKLTFRQAAERYRIEVIPTKAEGTRKANLRELETLLKFFDDPPGPLDAIRPTHVFNYLVAPRCTGEREPREIAAVTPLELVPQEGLYRPAEPLRRREPQPGRRPRRVRGGRRAAAGLRRRRPGAERCDGPCLPDRPAPGRRARAGPAQHQGRRAGAAPGQDEDADAHRHHRRAKGADRPLAVQEAPGRCTDQYPAAAGRGLAADRQDALRYRFDKARERAGIPKDQFQFRDLRAKAGTDKADSAGDIRQAQQQLGHQSVTTTEIYVRKRRGALTSPTK
ncbi:hypothetical protein SNK04_013969 [Fusarium graminearum]